MATQAPTRPVNGTPAKPAAAPQQQHQPAKDPHVEAGRKVLDAAMTAMVEYKPFQSETPIKLSARLVLTHLCTPTKKGHLCTESQALKFVMLCRSRGLNPWEGDAFIIGYDSDDGPTFSLVTAHQAYLKRAEAHPKYDGMESGVIVKRPTDPAAKEPTYELLHLDGDYIEPGDLLMGGWARVHIKGRKVPTYRRCRFTTFDTGRSRWKKDPCGMIVKVAEADALRSSFPNTFGGMSPEETLNGADVAEIMSAMPDVQPGRGADAHPEPPPFDRAACLRSVASQWTEALKSGIAKPEAWPKMLAEFEAVKIEDLTDDQLQQVEAQVAALFRTTDPNEPAGGELFREDGVPEAQRR